MLKLNLEVTLKVHKRKNNYNKQNLNKIKSIYNNKKLKKKIQDCFLSKNKRLLMKPMYSVFKMKNNNYIKEKLIDLL